MCMTHKYTADKYIPDQLLQREQLWCEHLDQETEYYQAPEAPLKH